MDSAKKAGQRLSDMVEDQLIEAVLGGKYPPGGALPLERDLAAELGVGRPTLREALQRLERDGWFSVRKGQPTRVNDYWRSGNLNILATLARHQPKAPAEFVDYLLELRVALTPAYVKAAVGSDPARVVAVLVDHDRLGDDPVAFAAFDWRLQKSLAEIAPNPVFTLILNSFDAVYVPLATEYFSDQANQARSRRFYRRLIEAAMARKPEWAEEVTLEAMNTAAEVWREARLAHRQAG